MGSQLWTFDPWHRLASGTNWFSKTPRELFVNRSSGSTATPTSCGGRSVGFWPSPTGTAATGLRSLSWYRDQPPLSWTSAPLSCSDLARYQVSLGITTSTSRLLAGLARARSVSGHSAMEMLTLEALRCSSTVTWTGRFAMPPTREATSNSAVKLSAPLALLLGGLCGQFGLSVQPAQRQSAPQLTASVTRHRTRPQIRPMPRTP